MSFDCCCHCTVMDQPNTQVRAGVGPEGKQDPCDGHRARRRCKSEYLPKYLYISVDTPALSIEVEVTNESHHGPLVGVAPWNGFRRAFAALRDRATVFYEPMGIEHLLGPAFGSIDWYFLRAQGIMGRGQAVHV